jgi:hypothetical protein
MDRRRFLLASGLTAGTVGLAGCTSIPLIGGGGQTPPPRKSSVFTDVEASEQGIVLELPDQPWIQSRAEIGNSGALAPPDAAGLLGGLSPVGLASAAKGGAVGATGRGDGGASRAPRSTHGYAKWHGGDGDDYDDWREEHDDDVDRYDAAIAAVGVAYLGSNAQYDDNEPGPGKPPGGWDETMSSVDGNQVVYETDPQSGWYRSGARLEAPGTDHTFGWESVDYMVERAGGGPKVDRAWKISPRL